jgi:hypothetical protein
MALVSHAMVLVDAAAAMLTHLEIAAQATIPNPAPRDPTNGSPAIELLFAIAKWGVLVAGALGLLGSFAVMGIGKLADNPSVMSKAKSGIPYAVVAIIGGFLAIPVVNAIQGSLSLGTAHALVLRTPQDRQADRRGHRRGLGAHGRRDPVAHQPPWRRCGRGA